MLHSAEPLPGPCPALVLNKGDEWQKTLVDEHHTGSSYRWHLGFLGFLLTTHGAFTCNPA